MFMKEFMDKKTEILNYLHENVFDPILCSQKASGTLKKGVRLTIMRMNKLDFAGIRQYYWSALSGTDRSIRFADEMRAEGFTRFEEILEDFRRRFDDKWLNS
jgi:hypothetical protein